MLAVIKIAGGLGITAQTASQARMERAAMPRAERAGLVPPSNTRRYRRDVHRGCRLLPLLEASAKPEPSLERIPKNILQLPFTPHLPESHPGRSLTYFPSQPKPNALDSWA